METERTREATRTLTHIDNTREEHDSFEEMPSIVDDDNFDGGRGHNVLPDHVRDGLADANKFVAPTWLSRKLPYEWTNADACRKNVAKPGRPCCLFAPLQCCHGSVDMINGFCAFHLRAIFNLTYQNDAMYSLNKKGSAVIWYRNNCFVLDPRPVDNRMTPVFPIFELFDREPTRPDDINLYNLERFLTSVKAPNWEKTYSVHVNFLYRLITVHSSLAQPQRPSREDQLLDNQLILHWNAWNEYYSWILRQNAAEIYMFYSDGSEAVKPLPVSKCTTITQMVVRLFTEPYTYLDDFSFYTAPANYGLYTRAHLAYHDNMCSYGTTATENVTTIGALATLTMLRTDSCKTELIQYDRHGSGQMCSEDFCVTSKINSNNTALNRSILVTGGDIAPSTVAAAQTTVTGAPLVQ